MKVLSFLGAVGIGMFAGVWLFATQEKRARNSVAQRLLNINDASQDEIMKTLGVDAVVAESIVEHRPYPSKIDLLGRMVVPEELYNSIKHNITHKAS
jgi:DNA uptake protein ComE-like DNA-binding protein